MTMLAKLQTTWRQSAAARWYYGRDTQDQKVILAVTALVVLSLSWVLVWKPVSDWQAESSARQQRAQQMYDWLRANENAARQAARQATSSRRGNSITPLITRAAAAHEITVNRLQPEANGVVSVALQQQSFNKIIAWVNQLHENNGVSVERASIDGADAPGYVNAQLRLN